MKKTLKILWFLTKLGLFFLVLGVSVLFVAYKYYEPELPSVDAIREHKLQVPLRVYSADGKLISVFGTKRRIPINIEDVPVWVKQAYIAAEDANFYDHYGFDVKGILRAVWQIVTTGEKQSGGSTITQQLTRNVFLSLDQTWTRKIKELFLAVKLERTISKDEILELYLNKIPLGHRAYGIAAAADVYYGKRLDELTLAESAMLAAPPKAPSRINPVTSPERALARRNYVLGRMLNLGYINQQEHDAAVAEPDRAFVHAPAVELNAPWVAELVRAELVERYGETAYTDGYTVYTSIHSKLQVAAENAIRNGLHDYDRRHGFRGPIQHHDLSVEGSVELVQQKLEKFPTPGGLQAALVTEVNPEFAIVRLRDGQDADLQFEHSGWAAPYIDNERIGKKPAEMTEILDVGDVVMVRRNATGQFELSQIPNVQGALVSMNPNDGAILAMIGGYDYFLSKFNRATQAKRQPGSGFKPIIYSGALENGLNAASIINDAPIVFEDDKLEKAWRPENFSEKFFGPTRMREGIVSSRNLVSIRVLNRMGIGPGRRHILKFGFNESDIPSDLSIALGSPNVPPMEMSRAFSVFANGGYLVNPYLIDRILDQDGELLHQHRPLLACDECETVPKPAIYADAVAPPETTETSFSVDASPADAAELNLQAPRVISPENQFIIESFMQDVIKRGTGRRALELERNDLAGKTGTANDQIDAWFNGYQRNIVTNVWIGFDTPETLGRGEVGGRAALPMWIEYMRVALADEPAFERDVPPGIVIAYVDKDTGELVKPNAPNSIREYFMVGRLPAEKKDNNNQTVYDDLF